MKEFWARFFGSKCEHQHALTVRSVGVERSVCEACGNLSFSIAPNLMISHELVTSNDHANELPKVSGM